MKAQTDPCVALRGAGPFIRLPDGRIARFLGKLACNQSGIPWGRHPFHLIPALYARLLEVRAAGTRHVAVRPTVRRSSRETSAICYTRPRSRTVFRFYPEVRDV